MQFDLTQFDVTQLDELLLVQILIGAAAATVVGCAILLLQAPRRERPAAKKSRSRERRPAERYSDELAA
jgi:hypothetical protein